MISDHVLFPEIGFKKSDAIGYYKRVAKWLLPHLKNRPVSFKRFPDTIRGESFWEKDAPSFTPKWVKTVAVPRREEESDINYIIINDVRTLTWVVDVGGIEIHPFLHTAKNIERATAMVFDLDPGAGASIADCCRVALILRDALGKLKSFAKVSGSKGLQVYVPLNTNHTHDDTQPFARMLAEELARKHPKLITAKMPKQFRARKVFIDWSQNADFKTTVSVYSLRAKRETPFVSMPLTWKEVAAAKELYWTPDQALHRLRKRGDLFAEVLALRQKLPLTRSASRDRPLPRGEVAAKLRVRGLPKARSQSGRRLFVLPKTEMGNELWLDMRGKFKRWILRPDREGGKQLIAMPAGEFAIDPAYFHGEVPKEWRKRVSIEDIGAYELIDGSYPRRHFDLFFSGKTLQGEWLLEKLGDESHRSWSFKPVR
ncbi:MAG TPA: non-homologous end-joining DNA ligase [Thermoanaerobaculia bacterium]|nr:non-homologous end-joining DNA ligase [Thermoanaerobaculia bacterium]